MALVRILVDGYSLLHNWPELAPGHAPHSSEAREELIHRLTLYRDAVGTPLTIVFDGSQPRGGKALPPDSREFEVIFSHEGQTADDIIERVASRMQPYGEVMVVTDDYAERDTVFFHGGTTASCANFINQVEIALTDLGKDIERHNRAERRRFNTPR
jgi:uncharacterized protein